MTLLDIQVEIDLCRDEVKSLMREGADYSTALDSLCEWEERMLRFTAGVAKQVDSLNTYYAERSYTPAPRPKPVCECGCEMSYGASRCLPCHKAWLAAQPKAIPVQYGTMRVKVRSTDLLDSHLVVSGGLCSGS